MNAGVGFMETKRPLTGIKFGGLKYSQKDRGGLGLLKISTYRKLEPHSVAMHIFKLLVLLHFS